MTWLFNAGGRDGYNDCRNLLKVDTDRHGVYFLPMKALAVAAGWTVKGSGRTGAHEFQGTTGGAGTGSGGAYDVWNSVANVSSALSWCVLEAPDGVDEMLLVGTDQAGNTWDAYGHVMYLPGGGYTSAGIGPTTPPATVAGEFAIRGGRPFTSGVNLAEFSGSARMHFAFDPEPDQGVYRFLVFNTTPANAPHDSYGLLTLEGGPEWDTKLFFYYCVPGGGAVAGANVFGIRETQSFGLASVRTFTAASLITTSMITAVAPTGSNDDPFDGTDIMWTIPYLRQNGVANEEYYAGVCKDLFARAHAGLDYPNYFDFKGYRYVHWGVAALPWGRVVDSPPAPLTVAGVAGTDTGCRVENLRIPGETQYIQRVWDSGLATWCYYTLPFINAAPLAADTMPNYTGAISHHSVVQVLPSED